VAVEPEYTKQDAKLEILCPLLQDTLEALRSREPDIVRFVSARLEMGRREFFLDR
jgi:hypothetical protein